MKSEPSLFRHMQQQQSNLLTLTIGLSMALLVTRAPQLSNASDWGLFFSTAVVLVHWHYGANYVLWHLGPTSDPMRSLWDAGIILLLVALPLTLQQPVYWFVAVGGTYFLAWVKYYFALRQDRYDTELREYMSRKSWIEVAAFVLTWFGAVSAWFMPQAEAALAWGTFAGNVAFLYAMTRWWGYYRMGWTTEEWDLDQPSYTDAKRDK